VLVFCKEFDLVISCFNDFNESMIDYSRVGKRQRPPWSLEQKVGLGIFIICGIGGVVLGGSYLVQNISNPFDVEYSGPGYVSLDEQENLEIELQKSRDLDADGLNDYDEQYVYKTSPYVADTDSDGYDDKMEIESGNDPNCPRDEDCGASTVDAQVGSNMAATDLIGDRFDIDGVAPDVSTSDGLESYMKSLSAQEIRDYIIQSGSMDEATVNAIDDETILSLFDEALKQTELPETE